VILKPDPGRPQELYLGSLEALGIDTRAHDVRFVEDNWENPTLGAWGLGWEVWMDGALMACSCSLWHTDAMMADLHCVWPQSPCSGHSGNAVRETVIAQLLLCTSSCVG
jgi:hypothetical protein